MACGHVFLVRAVTLQPKRERRGINPRPGARTVVTQQPDSAPPVMVCPTCRRSLDYRETFISGRNDGVSDRWDYLHCAFCKLYYEYRHRIRRLRPAPRR